MILSCYCFSQNQQIVLKQNHIKEIKIYNQKENSNKYLSKCCFINDSGLVFKTIELNNKQDTISTQLYYYDNLKREIKHEIKYNKDSSLTYNYTYSDNEVKTLFPNGKITIEKNNLKKRGNKTTTYSYINDTLSRIIQWKSNKRINKGKIKNINSLKGWKHNIKQIEYKDSLGNFIKSIFVIKNTVTIKKGGYAEYDEKGNIIKDKWKYRKYKYKRHLVTLYKYNNSHLLVQIKYCPVPSFKRSGYLYSGSDYEIETYEYLTK